MLSTLSNFEEFSVNYDGTGCPSVERFFDSKSTIFLLVSGGKVKVIHMKTWFEVTFFISSLRQLKFERKKPDRVFTTTCPWSSMNWNELGVGRLSLCGTFLFYWVLEVSGLYWGCCRPFDPLVQEMLDLAGWYCLSRYRLQYGLKPFSNTGLWIVCFPYLDCWLKFWGFWNPKLGPLLLL